MKATPSIHLGGVMIVVIGLITLWFVWWWGAGEAVPTVLSTGNGGSGRRSPVELGVGTDRAAERAVCVAGEVSREDPGRSGLHESLGAALAAARHAVEKIDPAGAHARGAEYFAANPGQQLRAWFSGDGVELASGIPTPESEEAWSVKLRLAGIGRGMEVAVVEPGVVGGDGSRIEVEHRMEEAGGDTARQELELWNPRDRGRLARSGGGGTPAVPGDHPFGRRFSRKAESSGQLAHRSLRQRLGLARLGAGGTPAVPGVPAVQGSGASVTQWFENGTDGLEQGFTLEEAPPGEAGNLALVMEVDGSLRAEAMNGTDGVCFVDATGEEVLHYTGLKAWDAEGRALVARMEVRSADALALVIADGGATYPVTIDPMFAHVQARLAEESTTGDYAGVSVALEGETALVGVMFDDLAAATSAGSAYVFVRDGSVWSQQAKLTAVEPGTGDWFGHSVALEGDTAVIGAPYDDHAGGGDAGSASVFVRTEATWDWQSTLIADDAVGSNAFGFSVSLSGERALVGAPRVDTHVAGWAGAGYLFERSGSEWIQEAKLIDDEAATGDQLGFSVALLEDTALLGASIHYLATPASGKALVFARTGETWSRQAKLTPDDGKVGDEFGASVALSGATALVGAPEAETASGEAAGGAYVFDRVGAVWNQQAKLTAADAAAGDEFGDAVVISGDTALIGAVLDDTVVGNGTGSAYLFMRNGALWGQQVKLTGGVDASEDDHFGAAVALSGGTALVGASGDDTLGDGAGSVYVFLVGHLPEIKQQPQSRTVVSAQPVSFNVTATGYAPLSYQWRRNGYLTAAPILTYFLEHAQTGTAPSVLSFEVVSTNTGMPYAYVGQIRSDVGASSGFVVKPRVVATAGHVVFDDGSLAAVTGLQWLFQRDRGSYEPAPQTPRGFYLFDGYSAQRIAEGTPGSSSPASQELDVAALYFDDPAGRGGFGGFLASDAVPNEWVSADNQKILVGYPVVGVPANQAGRMHATPAGDVSLVPGGSAHTYTTDEIRSTGGGSGGPLCVQFEGGAYYPAAIYLGGTGQTVVRVIDSGVIRLFDAAEDSAATGNNNTGGGITLTSVMPVAAPNDPGILKVTVEPEAARAAGGGWRLLPESGYRSSGSQLAGLNPGSYTMELTTVAGFQEPTPQTVSVIGGSLNEVTFTYAVEHSELDAWRQTHFGTTENIGDAADDADPDGDGCINIDEFIAGTDPKDPNDCLKVLRVERVGVGFTVLVAGKAGRVYALELSEDLAGGTWATRASVGPLGADVMLSLTDPVAPPEKAYYRVRVSKP